MPSAKLFNLVIGLRISSSPRTPVPEKPLKTKCPPLKPPFGPPSLFAGKDGEDAPDLTDNINPFKNFIE
jgi:hypothetical protein